MKKEYLRLLPSLREKKRYLMLLFKLKTEEQIKKVVDKAILNYIGLLGYAQAGPMIIEVGKAKNKGPYALISINRSFVDKIKAAFLMANIQCIGVSGSIKKVRRFLR